MKIAPFLKKCENPCEFTHNDQKICVEYVKLEIFQIRKVSEVCLKIISGLIFCTLSLYVFKDELSKKMVLRNVTGVILVITLIAVVVVLKNYCTKLESIHNHLSLQTKSYSAVHTEMG